jgi:hypothetical protein
MKHVLPVGCMTKKNFKKKLNLSKNLKLIIWRCLHTGWMEKFKKSCLLFEGGW